MLLPVNRGSGWVSPWKPRPALTEVLPMPVPPPPPPTTGGPLGPSRSPFFFPPDAAAYFFLPHVKGTYLYFIMCASWFFMVMANSAKK